MKILHGHYSVINLCFTDKITLKNCTFFEHPGPCTVSCSRNPEMYPFGFNFSRSMDELMSGLVEPWS